MRIVKLVLGVAFMLAAAACQKEHQILSCNACIEREGNTFCGQGEWDQSREKSPLSDDEGKLAAGKQACVEYAARKGGGYAGPPYQKALAECQAGVTAKDLRRTRCDTVIVHKTWQPREGI